MADDADVVTADEPGEPEARESAAGDKSTTPGTPIRRDLMFRAAPESVDEAERSVEVVISTGATVRRWDWGRAREYDETLAIEPDSVRLDRLNGGAPLLAVHNWFSLDAVIGSVMPGTARVEDGELRARVRFSKRSEVDGVFGDVLDGIIRSVSVGYDVRRWEIDEEASPPVYRAVDWEPYEVSVVPVPADPHAGFRSHHRAKPASEEVRTMNENDVNEAGAEPAVEPEAREMSEIATERPAPIVDEAAMEAARSDATRSERDRVGGIQGLVRKLSLTPEVSDRWIEDGITLDEARTRAIDEVASRDEASDVRNIAPMPVSGATRLSSPREPDKGEFAARIIRALAANRGDPERAARFAERQWSDTTLARALASGDGTAGGFLVPEQYSAELIELLRPLAVVRRLGATVLPMPGGTLTVPKITGGASAEYVGENQNIGKTEPKFGQLRLTARKLAAVVPISNDLIRFSSPQADAVVRDDVVSAMAQREDAAFIRDDGTGNAPKGLRYWALAANVIAANGTVNLTNVTTDLGKLVLGLRNSNVRMIRPGWLFSPRTEHYLMTIRDGNGNFAFREDMLAGRLWGYPFGVTTQIPDNLGGGSDESEIYLVDMADSVIAESTNLIIDVSSEAAYHDGSSVVSAFSLDQTVIRVIASHDFGMRHDASVAILTTVKWGA